MEAGSTIRSAVERVTALRQAQHAQAALRGAVAAVKRTQSRRFAGTYADMLADGSQARAARFFLDELYSDKDFTQRDAQFARIAGTIERLFPAQVSATAVAIAQVHALTEEMDLAMGWAWLDLLDASLTEAQRYVRAWRAVDRRRDRETQLRVVLELGQEMARLTRTPGLRTMLRMMRGPAAAAGLGSLQRFLEAGFDTFAAMAREGTAEAFLQTIDQRERAVIADLFDGPLVACETRLAHTLGQAP